jgi:NTP pyrophosphatase (non-canonical NTP hydrolase)
MDNNMLMRTDLTKIVEHFGKYQQFMKLGEEVGELYKAILNYENGITKTDHEIVEEFSDVMLIMNQIKEIYNIDPYDVEMSMDFKLRRTMDKYNIE